MSELRPISSPHHKTKPEEEEETLGFGGTNATVGSALVSISKLSDFSNTYIDFLLPTLDLCWLDNNKLPHTHTHKIQCTLCFFYDFAWWCGEPLRTQLQTVRNTNTVQSTAAAALRYFIPTSGQLTNGSTSWAAFNL